MTEEIIIKIKYDDGEKPFNGLDFYHGTKSLAALSESFIVATNAALNQDAITQTTAAKGFRTALRKSFIHSYTQSIALIIEDPEIYSAYKRLSFEGYVDFLKMAFGSAVGKHHTLERRGSKRLARELEDTEWLTQRIENVMLDIHSPVKYQGLSIQLFAGPRLIETFDKQTLAYVDDEVKSTEIEQINVVISKLNGRTGTGRFIYEMEGESTPFYPIKRKITQDMITILSSSLDSFTNGIFQPVKASVTAVHTSDGRLKRYILHSVEEI